MQDLRLAVAAAAGIDLDLKPRGFSLGLGFDAGEDDGEDDGDDRVRVVGISEGIPPEDRIAYGSRDDQTDAKFEKCFVAHFELELDDPRGRKSLGAGDKWSALRALHASLVDAVGPSVISGLGRGSLTIRGTGKFILIFVWAISMTSCFVYRRARRVSAPRAAAVDQPGAFFSQISVHSYERLD